MGTAPQSCFALFAGIGDTLAGRYAGFEMGNSSDTDADFTVTYGYDEDRRVLDQVKGTGLPSNGVLYDRPNDGVSSSPGSDMVSFYRYLEITQQTTVSVTREFEAQRDAVLSVTNEEALYYNTISKYTYGHDDLGRRTSVVYEGTAFDQDHLFNWGYNPRSELVLAEQHAGTDPEDPGTAYSPNGSFAYLYDDIGNP